MLQELRPIVSVLQNKGLDDMKNQDMTTAFCIFVDYSVTNLVQKYETVSAGSVVKRATKM
jgi:hypothetical protein